MKHEFTIINNNLDYIWLDQLNNSSNPQAHYEGTGAELVEDFKLSEKKIDLFVVGMGSGGTISGTGKRIKEKFKDCRVLLVQPYGYDIFKKSFIFHKIQGWGIGMVPPVFNEKVVDDTITVSFQECIEVQRYLARNDGLLLGISSGGNIAAAKKVAKTMKSYQNIVTVAPDSGLSYLEVF